MLILSGSWPIGWLFPPACFGTALHSRRRFRRFFFGNLPGIASTGVFVFGFQRLLILRRKLFAAILAESQPPHSHRLCWSKSLTYIVARPTWALKRSSSSHTYHLTGQTGDLIYKLYHFAVKQRFVALPCGQGECALPMELCCYVVYVVIYYFYYYCKKTTLINL